MSMEWNKDNERPLYIWVLIWNGLENLLSGKATSFGCITYNHYIYLCKNYMVLCVLIVPGWIHK